MGFGNICLLKRIEIELGVVFVENYNILLLFNLERF